MSFHHVLGHGGGDHGAMPGTAANGSHHWGHLPAPDEFAESETISSWLLVAVCAALMCVAVPSNLLVLAAFLGDAKLRTYGNLFVINLCLADLGVGAVSVPLTVLEEALKLAGRGWPLGRPACHLAKTVQHVFLTASILTVLVICHDRHLAVRHPLAHRRRRTTAGALRRIAGAWAASGLVWLAFILAWGLAAGEDSLPADVCTAMYNTNHYATGAAIALAMWLPYPTILVMYCRVYATVRSAGVRRRSSRRCQCGKGATDSGSDRSSGGPAPTLSTSAPTVACLSSAGMRSGEADPASDDGGLLGRINRAGPSDEADRSGQRAADETPITAPPLPALAPAKTAASTPSSSSSSSPSFSPVQLTRSAGKRGSDGGRKAMLTLSLVVASYAVCWLPYGIIVPITSICQMHPGSFPPLPAYYNAAVVAFSMCQSAVNPFCYAAAQPAIRRAVARILGFR